MQIDSFRLQIEMARNKMDNAKLAKAVGLSKNTICRMQHNNPECKPVNLGMVADALGVDVINLILMQE